MAHKHSTATPLATAPHTNPVDPFNKLERAGIHILGDAQETAPKHFNAVAVMPKSPAEIMGKAKDAGVFLRTVMSYSDGSIMIDAGAGNHFHLKRDARSGNSGPGGTR